MSVRWVGEIFSIIKVHGVVPYGFQIQEADLIRRLDARTNSAIERRCWAKTLDWLVEANFLKIIYSTRPGEHRCLETKYYWVTGAGKDDTRGLDQGSSLGKEYLDGQIDLADPRWNFPNFEVTTNRPTTPEINKDSIWNLFHSKVREIARSRFDSGHYADAVEAAFKALNVEIKQIVLKATGEELDGTRLMQRAFSVEKPIVKLENLDTESGRSVQQGFLMIASGAMTGIRNPKAHDNIEITSELALHHLFLASLLLRRLDSRLDPPAG